jgi:hypothetical protein
MFTGILSSYRDVHSAQRPVNSILCTGEILTEVRQHYKAHYIIIWKRGDQDF